MLCYVASPPFSISRRPQSKLARVLRKDQCPQPLLFWQGACCRKRFIITTICHSLGFALLDAKHLRRRGTFDSLSPLLSVFGWTHLLLIYARWHIAPEKSTSKWLGWVHQSISSLHTLRLMHFTVRVPSSVCWRWSCLGLISLIINAVEVWSIFFERLQQINFFHRLSEQSLI